MSISLSEILRLSEQAAHGGAEKDEQGEVECSFTRPFTRVLCILGELSFAMPTPEQSGVVFDIIGANSDIFFAPNAVFWAVFILTAEVFEIVHDTSSLGAVNQ